MPVSLGRRDTIKHLAPLVTLASGLLGGWLVPGDRVVQSAPPNLAVAPIAAAAASRTHSALPDLAVPETRSLSVASSNPQSIAAEAFSREILRLSADSDRLDGLWQIYKEECKVSVKGDYDFGREWFSLWDGTARPTLKTANCQDVPTSLIDQSETIRHDLIRARAVAQETGIGEATEVGVLKWHTLHWTPRK